MNSVGKEFTKELGRNWTHHVSTSRSSVGMQELGITGHDSQWSVASSLGFLFHKDTMCCCLLVKSCLTLWDPMYCSPPGSSIHGISQERILEWVATSFSRGSSWARDQTHVSCIGRRVLYRWAIGDALKTLWQVSVSCSIMSNSLWPMDWSPPGSFVHGILQARKLEWVAISFSRGSSRPRDWTQVSRIAGGLLSSWANRVLTGQTTSSPFPTLGRLSKARPGNKWAGWKPGCLTLTYVLVPLYHEPACAV